MLRASYGPVRHTSSYVSDTKEGPTWHSLEVWGRGRGDAGKGRAWRTLPLSAKRLLHV